MAMVYTFYLALTIIGIALNVAAFILRLRRRKNSQMEGVSDEHHWCLLIHDLLYAFVSLAMFISLLQDVFKQSDLLCHVAGFSCLYILIALSWTPLVSAIVLYEKERYSLHTKAYEGMTTKIVSFLTSALLLISAALVAVNYAPIMKSGKERHLLCLPVTFPYQDSSEYSQLLVVLIWSGLLSTWACLVTWLVFLVKNSRSVRFVRNYHRNTKLAGIQAVIVQTIWTVTISLATAFYWTLQDNVLLAAILFAIMMVIGHPLISLITHWLVDGDTGLLARLQREVPSRLMDISILPDTTNQSFLSFRALWMGKCGEKVQGVIKLYRTDQGNRWLREVKALALLGKTEHPNIVKYLWAGRGGALKVPENTTKEFTNLFADPNNRMVSIQTCDQRSLQQLLLLTPEVLTDAVARYIALDIALGLVHLRNLQIVHNNLSSKSIFIKCLPKAESLSAVIGEFEESDQVTLDYCSCQNTEIVEKQASGHVDNKFSADIRSYALLLLELVASWNEHNGRPIKPTSQRKSSKVPKERRSVTHSKPVRSVQTPTLSSSTLPRQPKFEGILEEPHNNLHTQKAMQGETTSREIESVDDTSRIGEANYEFYKPHALGVIIPNSASDQIGQKRYFSHLPVTRQGSDSICSTDTGYHTSLESHPMRSPESELVWPCKSGKTPWELSNVYGKINNSQLCVENEIQIGVVQLETNHNNNIVPRTISADASLNYHRSKALAQDILDGYEEYRFQDDLALPEETTSDILKRATLNITEQGTFDKHSSNVFKHASHNQADTTDLSSDLDLAELAAKVTQDVEILLKARSRSNSETSSLSMLPPSHFKCHPMALAGPPTVNCAVPAANNSVVSETAILAEDNSKYYVNGTLADKSKLQSLELTPVSRCGITEAQINYSKALVSEYDIVTPQLLYLNASSTKGTLKSYREQLGQPSLNQLLVVSEGCWTREPVLSADSVLTQLRQVFIVS